MWELIFIVGAVALFGVWNRLRGSTREASGIPDLITQVKRELEVSSSGGCEKDDSKT